MTISSGALLRDVLALLLHCSDLYGEAASGPQRQLSRYCESRLNAALGLPLHHEYEHLLLQAWSAE
jgi:hypothetical protein